MQQESQTNNPVGHESVDNNWHATWNRHCSDPWFQKRLDQSARAVLRSSGCPQNWVEDIKQEAIVMMAQNLRNDPTLGFDATRGKFRSLISTIIYRCCLKSQRQFRTPAQQSLECSSHQPFADTTSQLEEQLDLSQCVARLPRQYRLTLEDLIEGQSVEAIAISADISERTIYRRIRHGLELLKSMMTENLDRIAEQPAN